MRREDLFVAIGGVDDRRLARCEKYRNPSLVIHREESNMSNGNDTHSARQNRIKMIWLIAAIIALMLFLMGSAVAALVRMRVEKVEFYVQSGERPREETIGFKEVHEEETADIPEEHKEEPIKMEAVYEGEKISFDELHSVFVELGTYYPQEIPEGYTMTFVSDDAPMQNQVIHYENDAGAMIKYWIYVGDPASSTEIYGIEEKTKVDINGQPGILYQQKGGVRTLVWINETQGYGFVIRADDANVDIMAMAESTTEGEPLVATRSGETLKALEELGDFSPEYLPEGFEELNVQGSPLAEGGWYSYVRKLYVNKTENTNIYFEYETYVIVTEDGYTDDARTACGFYIPGYLSRRDEVEAEDVQINGMLGIMTDEDIAWVDTQTRQVYHLHSEDVTGAELLKVAQSISGGR